MFRYMLVASAVLACAYAAASYNTDATAYVVKNSADIQPEGQYQYQYETSNGIAAQESGLGGHQASGGYSYYSPEGQLVQISYLADENGFQPQGELLPTPPPIPAAILKSLEYIRTHPQYQEPQQQYQQVQYQQVQQQQYRSPARVQNKRVYG
ncbi:larval cuticle protein LCP-17-like [Drosophila subobscura]|uniref:larval cuticle protein LCP-17-like n=1 Tax=Drosophila subobscura TaxID=7241 RepID=UPI00155AE129|nr:larval cuticle protein LCP-17-like [Drosophila subobscura]